MKTPTRFTATLLSIPLALLLVATACNTGSPTTAPAPPSAQPGATEAPTPRPTDVPPSSRSGPPLGTSAQPTSTSVPAPTATPEPQPSPVPSVPAAPPPVPTAARTGGAQRAAAPAAARFSGAEALAHVRALAGDIGSRSSGSPALTRAAAYIRDQLAGLGYQAALQPYDVTNFRERSTELLLAKPQEAEIAALALVYSGSGSVTGELAYAGLGRPADIPPSGLRGKVALVDRGGGITFQAKTDAAIAAGASAIILANDRQGELRGSLARPSSVPVVSILQVDGERLSELLRQGPVTVTLTVDALVSQREGANVVATGGSAPGRKMVIVGAHYDSVSAGPGANDNASGVATMLQLAAATRGRTYPFDLVFVAFGDEEIGLVGSKEYAARLSPAQRSQIVAMLNFDMVGVGDAMEFGGDAALTREARQLARDLGQATRDMSAKDGRSSDHASFLDAGIPAVFFYRSDDPNYHTANDTPDRIAAANLEAAGSVAIRLLDSLAQRN